MLLGEIENVAKKKKFQREQTREEITKQKLSISLIRSHESHVRLNCMKNFGS